MTHVKSAFSRLVRHTRPFSVSTSFSLLFATLARRPTSSFGRQREEHSKRMGKIGGGRNRNSEPHPNCLPRKVVTCDVDIGTKWRDWAKTSKSSDIANTVSRMRFKRCNEEQSDHCSEWYENNYLSIGVLDRWCWRHAHMALLNGRRRCFDSRGGRERMLSRGLRDQAVISIASA